ncbi:Dynein heavy chain 7, axonemal [Phytophthora fragariae]|uniref:Dynein heavy chain 7, axonemal n=1 Tax=Phytophthora fragariae TaxID=53985 RepID=A0A6A3SNE0_9STRA|nr:Dynein heavy chain 7, axonemal [Phytophthora fragariae]KAE8930034.1 Dynein heavy chain 7, axonemal [Phytophthora fragariae]KAE8992187.1 Dynein heavy chain 7, axonemal [Phytophthora fragariae]KAE9091657.1 Dynein heavy chain 7, axonemal [Phytophthora fragariae]KAE9093242.1 Dynein heavy chain 7, axonemal [Phytophthora fragariae]
MAQSRPGTSPNDLELSDEEEQSAATPQTTGPSSLTPEQQLLARFKLHKQHRKEKERRLQQTRLAAACRASRSAAASAGAPKSPSSRQQKPPKAGAVDLTRVDHNNRPHRWKSADELLQEQERRAQQHQLTAAAPVRPYPGRLRGQALEEVPRQTVALTGRGETTETQREDEDILQLDQSQFPLHLFDSDEFEAHSPHEWLERERVGASPYFFQGEWRWRSCAVLSYDTVKAQYLVQFQGSDRQKWVRRINLRFESEMPVTFERRVAAARERREQVKAMLRFDDFLARQDASQLRAMGRPTLERVHARVVAGLPERVALLDSQPAASLLRQLTDTAIQEYMRSMKKAALLKQLRNDPELQARFQGLELVSGPKKPGAVSNGKVAIPDHDFQRNRRRVSTISYTSSPQLLAVLRRMYAGWEKTFQKLLLVQVDKSPTTVNTENHRGVGVAANGAGASPTMTLASQMPFRVLDFQALQAAHANKVAEILLVDWRRALVENVIDNLQDHFDLFLSDRVAYDASRLKRVLTGLELRLVVQLREVVHRSVEEWVRFVRHHAERGSLVTTRPGTSMKPDDAQGDVAASSRTDGGDDNEEEAEDVPIRPSRKRFTQMLDQKSIRAPRSSLFSVQLGFVNDEVVVEPSAQEVTAVLLEPLDAIVSAVQEIDRLDCDIMGLLSLDRRPLLDFAVGNERESERQKASRRAVVAECLDALQAAKVEVSDSVDHAMQAAHALAARFAAYTDFVHFDATAFIAELQPLQQQEQQLLKDGKPLPTADEQAYLPQLCAQIRKFHELAFRVDIIAFDFVALPLVCVHTSALKKQLRTRSLELRDTLISSLVRDARAQNLAITARYAAILARINEKPTNEAQLAKLKQFVGESKAVIAGIQREVAAIHIRLDALNEFSHKLSAEDFTLAHSTKEWPLKVAHAADSCDSALEEDKVRMMDRLALEKEAFELDLERFEGDVQAFTRYGEVEHTDKYVELAITLFDALQDARAKALDFNAREAVFGFPPTEYTPLLGKLESDFAPYYKLWTMSSEFHASRQAWLNGPFLELKGGAIESLVTEWWKASYKLSKSLVDDAPGSAEVALILRERTEEFKAYLPVIQSLASPALQERHWEKLRHTIGFEESEEELTLQLLLDRGITQHLETIQEIGTFAEKEYSLQKNLSAMIGEWEKVEFQTAPYRETGTYLLRSTDDIVALLDDHLVKTQTMRGSPYIKSIEKDCKAWEKKLQYSQQLLDEWMGCQRTWLYLEAIFSSEDIMRQMPTEARRFASVDALWRKTMEDTVADPTFLTVIAMDKLLAKFQRANEKLDEIQKGLNDYLEMKRLHFPRFFFLSNDELLEILSQTKEPRAVQPHLGKCFEGVFNVTFQDGPPLLITEMRSAEGEIVPLRLPVSPESNKNKGNVEMWLLEVEQSQWDSVRDQTERSLAAYLLEERETWMLKWPAQVVLAVSQVYWTQDVTRALNLGNGVNGIKAYVEELNSQLDKIVMLVRGNLTKLERTTIGALVVIDVHARDTISHMIEKDVENDQDFEWISQLRYYWAEGVKTGGIFDLQARIVNARVRYGYEYLGNTMRLVITPLTDRCYRTMMGAVDLMYGGAPEGPAGTGKTETVKDLSKAIAIQCVVFNCSDGLDYLAMAKFFKGLAGCGSWCCFDEFNRINIEVLSVIAQQILTINEGKKAGVDKFLFEGTFIKLNASANVFITMNPGYAGRAELPDNLKALFRPCAMMVPDYALISEIRLYSFGFAQARSNARKLTQVLQLASEQLSSQKHYDYGMRAVNSILVATGALRQQLGNDPFWTEDKIVLRSVQDVNLPKFTSDDLPLFRGITSDLFPDVLLPLPDHGALLRHIDETCVRGIAVVPDVNVPLECKPEFKMKVVQFYETVQVRHGLMIVGTTGSGKTCVVHSLATAMTSCYTEEIELQEENGTKGAPTLQQRVNIHTMNPKAITSGQLYGNFDENTHEWSDGVLACTYRNCARDTSPELQWVMFDGPVDAVWIENMNTVLDDNKKLCLMSGEIVKMTDRMRMVFETEDLEEASPATVSRVGMVFLEAKVLGWEVLVRTWLNTRLPVAFASHVEYLEESFRWIVPPMLYFVDKHCTVPTPVTFLEHAASLLRLFECALRDGFPDPPADGTTPATASSSVPTGADAQRILECVLIKAVVWSIGACIDTKSRHILDRYLRDFLSAELAVAVVSVDMHMQDGEEAVDDELGVPPSPSLLYFKDFVAKSPSYVLLPDRAALLAIPEEGLVYDYRFDTRRSVWVNWMVASGGGAFVIPRDAQFTQVLVPTIDSERNAWLLDTLIRHHFHVLCTGDTGTGKSVSIKKKLLSGLNDPPGASDSPPKFAPSIFLNFSAQTSANQTQDLIEAKLDKRRKGVLGPPLGQSCVIFVDDLNMPAKETYGAQPPIELLRQWMGHGGWYNRKDNSFTQLVDIQFIAAMGPPGGGRTRITQRYVRYFNLINFVPFDNDSLRAIFTRITDWFLLNFPQAVKQLGGAVVSATIDIYNTISQALLPTPAKSHYTFNLRDLSKVFQGVAQASSDTIKDGKDFVRLWSHECLRVFSDRLIDDKDRAWFADILSKTVKLHFDLQYASTDVRGPNATLIYGNFGGDGKNGSKNYAELRDRDKLQNAMQVFLEDYNNMSAAPMRLVLFQNAIEHVARISRVIHQPLGNALLVGVGGSGRKSLTTLAVFMAEYKLFQIEISKSYSRTEWRNDIKKVLQLSGLNNQPTVFLFSDTQIVEEAYLEDINGLLNTGEVANLWANDELVQMNEALEPAATASGVNAGNSAELYNFFVGRCRTNLHIVLALSPIGEAFRRRLRMFPSLVNCCTIDWFAEWPDEALRSVADYFLVDIELPAQVKVGIVDVCVGMQESVSELTRDFLQSLRRYYYVTPTSYLELLNTFKKLLNNKRVEVMTMKQRYDNGLTKLMETAEQVEKMQVELEALQPLLKVATIETDALLETISREQKEANVTKDIVGAEEKLCNEQAAEANAIKSSCEAELAEAIPALENAVKALQTLTKGDITEIKAMKKPPDGVKLVMEAVCIMMRVPPVKVKDPAGGTKKVDDYWGPAQKSLLGDTRFLQNLLEYDKDNIPVEAMDKVRPYAANPDFQAEKIRKASVAASGLCSWVHAMVVYDRVAKVVAPKREALKAATLALEKAQSELKVKQDALQVVLDKVARLEEDLAAAYKKKSDLEFQVDDCSKKLTRATQLIGGLGGEKARWSDMSAQLQIVYDNVVGDIMLASGVIAYLGAFTSIYRERAVDQWCTELTKQAITCSKTFTLTDTLGEAVQIRAWTIAKLPNDSFSIDNAIMLQRSNRWPLMIDPQGQANRWVKNMEESNNLKVVKQSQAGFVRMLENSIMIGAAVLIENMPEEIDPMLEPILLKQVVKTGGVATIRLGDNTVEYDPNFRLYMTTKLRNPHYPPETCVKVNLLNFMATEEGLQDQMLGIVVAKEEPVLEQQREKLVLEDAANKKTLKEIEDQILYLLQTAKGNILDDERLIETLGASKITANKIEEKVREAAVTQQMIAEKRQGYLPVAFRASQLFFCIADLTVIDPMYQYALEWFINLFVFSISRAESSSVLATRLDNLNDAFTFILYQNVCRSLFEKDKLLFAFLLAIKILVGNGTIDGGELRYFFTGNTQMDVQKPKPAGSEGWLNDKTWGNIVGLDALSSFTGFSDAFATELSLWEVSYNSTDPAETLTNISALATMDAFQRIIVLRCLRPDKVIPAVMSFVATQMGQRFIEPQPFDLKAGFDDSNCSTPLIFVLTPGADPMSELLKLAAELGFNKKFVAISLGQGQGPLAENAIAEAIDNGTWVCLQNCHLSVSWLPTLEKICEEITPDRVHASFRLWLTSEPTRAFPSYILQHGVKMTNEPPKGMRANLKGSYLTIDEGWVASCRRPREFKKLLFGLCFFHAVVRERTKFGPLGWNISYVFSSSDLAISKDQLKISLDDLQPDDPIPYAALAYLAGECNYGGRVTDDKDRRCLITILSDFYTRDILSDSYTFSPSGLYYAPSADGSLSVFLNYIDQLPMNEGPEVFGLHDNANISTAIAETNLLLESALSLQPRGASGGGGGAVKSWDEVLDETARDIAAKLPPLYDLEKAELAFPVSYSESMNTVLTQELGRFNRLLALLQISLVEIQKAIKGLVVMSAELEAMGNSMVNGHVPARWSAVAYPSLKPLGSWVTDFLARLAFLQNWLTRGAAPPVYWISGFFFTQAFITGTQQNYARKHKLPIDQVGYDMVVLAQPASELTTPAEDGAYVDGLFLEGARWDANTYTLAESKPRELYVPLPVLHLLPKARDQIEPIEDTDPKGTAHVYLCPVYKTSKRQGTLSTTGHSTNFVMSVRLPMSAQHRQKHWIRRGVALLTQLDT